MTITITIRPDDNPAATSDRHAVICTVLEDWLRRAVKGIRLQSMILRDGDGNDVGRVKVRGK